MAQNVYTRSLIWLASLGSLGYILMKVTAPSAEKIKQIENSANSSALTDEQKKKLLFVRRLKSATNEQPIYMKKKEP